MKIEITIDIAPEEVRRLYGLPDISKLQAGLIDRLQQETAKFDTTELGKLLTPTVASGVKSIVDYNKMLWSLVNPLAQKKTTTETDSAE
jgi:hypothetical protein